MSLRDVFENVLYDEVIEGKEFEMITIRHFSDFGQVVFKLEEKEV